MSFITKDSGARDEFETGAKRDLSSGKGAYYLLPMLALKRIADLYERGKNKYGERNWEKGMPFSRTVDSALRHLCQYLEGDRSEDHAAAVCFNMMAIMQYEEMIARGLLNKELNDLPDFTKPKTISQEMYN